MKRIFVYILIIIGLVYFLPQYYFWLLSKSPDAMEAVTDTVYATKADRKTYEGIENTETWLIDAIPNIFLFSIHKNSVKLLNSAYYFTQKGYDQFKNELERHNIGDKLSENKMVTGVSAEILSEPKYLPHKVTVTESVSGAIVGRAFEIKVKIIYQGPTSRDEDIILLFLRVDEPTLDWQNPERMISAISWDIL
jgi:hypothetical protein